MEPPTTATDDLVHHLEDLLSPEGDLLAAWLFGSRATGRARPDSDVDVDVAILAREPLPFDRRRDLETKLDLALGLEVQVTDLRAASADLCYRVFRDGVLLLDREPANRITFTVNRRNEYFDLLPFLLRYRRVENTPARDP